MEKLSVIVPVYNVEKYLSRCLDSIIGQTYKNLEIILIDDGSPDNSGRICDEYAAKDSRIIVIHQHNMGVSAARNAGLDVCTGEYVTFVDSDDWIDKEMYSEIMLIIKKYGVDLGVCGINNVMIEEDAVIIKPRMIWNDIESPTVLAGEDVIYKVFCNSGTLWNKIFKRHLIEDNRFNTAMTYGEDVDYLLRAMLDARSAVIIPKQYYNYVANRDGSVCASDINESSIEFLNNTIRMYHSLSEKGMGAVGISKMCVTINEVLGKIKGNSTDQNKYYIEECAKAARTVSLSDLIKFLLNRKVAMHRKKRFIIYYTKPEWMIRYDRRRMR